MRRPTIQKRLTLWYAATVLLLLGLFFGVLYLALAPALTYRTSRMLQSSALEIDDELALVDGYLQLDDDDLDLPPGVWFTLFDLEWDVALSNHPGGWMDDLDWRGGEPPYSVRHSGRSWMLYDSWIYEDGLQIAMVRAAMPLDAIQEASAELLLLAAVLFPVIGAAAVLVGRLIARNALRPVDAITAAARDIRRGDLSRRLHFTHGPDEVGRLADTFDEMLDTLQATFLREQQFTADASHELRTPLSVILATAHDVLGRPDASPEEYRDAVAAMEKRARGMQAMLSQLLLLARDGRQSRALETAPLELGPVVQDIAEEMAAAAGERDMALQVEADADVVIPGDLLLITRLVMNLLDNAVKYGRPGGCIRVAVRAEGAQAVLTVADDGVGIAPEHLPHIFRRFYRADPARSGGGSGLGLALAEWIVRLHGGDIRVESEPGRGSTFTVRLPLEME